MYLQFRLLTESKANLNIPVVETYVDLKLTIPDRCCSASSLISLEMTENIQPTLMDFIS